jgi:hypothetical protein
MRLFVSAIAGLIVALGLVGCALAQTPPCAQISQCPAATLPLTGNEAVLGVQGAKTVQITTGSIANVLPTTAQSANTFLGGPVVGPAAAPVYRLIVGADLPNPSATTLGGIESIATVSHQFLTGISTGGVPSQAQPAFTDVSGTAQITQGGTGATTAVGALNALSGLPHEPNNTALAALVNSAFATVVRDGFAIAGDAPPLTFTPQLGTCAANGMVNDGGSCVNSTADSNSFKADFTALADVREWGAKCDGSTSDQTAINAAETAASTIVGVSPLIPAGVNCAISSAVVLLSDAAITDRGEITYTGAAAGPMFKTSSSAPTNRTGIVGDTVSRGKINPGTTLTGDIFQINGGLAGRIDHLEIEGGNAAVTVFDFSNTFTTTTPAKNTSLWEVDDITTLSATTGGSGSFGTVVKLSGQSGGPGNYVTLNEFKNLHFGDVTVMGVNFVGYADTNTFINDFFSLVGTGVIGVDLNTGVPAAPNDITQETFYQLTIDCIAAGSSRYGVVVGDSSADRIYGLIQNSPTCENGEVSNPSGYNLVYDDVSFATGATTFVNGNVRYDSGAMFNPSACTGAGSAPVCTLLAGNDIDGVIQIASSSGGGQTATGSVTLHFGVASAGGHACVFTPVANFNGRAVFTAAGVDSTHTVANWDNNAVTTSASTNYDFAFHCPGV